MPTSSPHTTGKHALEALDAALDSRRFATTLLTRPGRPPQLSVASRAAGLTQHLCACDGWYWWPWAEPITPADDPQGAARKIATVLRTAPGAAS